MDTESFYLLLSFVHDTLQVDEAKAASHGSMIIPELCLYCTLHYLAGASYLDVIVFASISTSSFYRIAHKTIHAINLTDELLINFPQMMAKCRAAVAGFANISFQSAIANCIGALDDKRQAALVSLKMNPFNLSGRPACFQFFLGPVLGLEAALLWTGVKEVSAMFN